MSDRDGDSTRLDLTPLLKDWEFKPNDIVVRYVTGLDGKEKLQLRIDLGVMQLELDGRPDGKQVDGHESWLDWHREQQAAHDAENPDAAPYQLDSDSCAELMREGVQYYHRYLGFWHSGRYELCARDTQRNLSLFEFVRTHAKNDRDKMQFDQWRPYVTMMHARAVGTPLVELKQWDAATGVVDAAIRDVRQFLEDYDQEEQEENLSELKFLKRWREEIQDAAGDGPNPVTKSLAEAADPAARVQAELSSAIEQERYEDAARLRDQLRQIDQSSLGGDP
ncbi:MAG: UvrB/UvrC motif-containing protein [Planctomycetota bacterium]